MTSWTDKSQLQCWTECLSRFSTLSCPLLCCLSWMTSLFVGLEWVCDVVNMQYSRNHRFGTINFSCYDWRVIPLAFIWTTCCWRVSVILQRLTILQWKLDIWGFVSKWKKLAQSARLAPITGIYMTVLSNLHQMFFSNLIETIFFIVCFAIYVTHEIRVTKLLFTTV